MEQRELPVIAASITNLHGAGLEDAKIKGISHMVEHMLFTGTKTRTHEDISREIEKKGGILNAFTASEVTSYWFKLPSEHLFKGFDILCDMLKNAIFNLEKFEKEKKVILEEIKMYHDTPERYIYDIIAQNLYSPPFGLPVIGDANSVSSLSRDFVIEYFKKHYSPSTYLAVLVGKADFDTVCDYLEQQFPSGQRTIPQIKVLPIICHTVEERAGIDQAHYIFGVHAPLYGTHEYSVLEVLDAYLANGMSSRLFLKIREEKGLAYTVRGSLNAERSYSYYTIYTGTNKVAISEIQKIILDEFVAIEKMNAKDLAEAKQLLIGQRKISSEESTKVMTELLFAEVVGKAEDYYEHDKRIQSVNLQQVKTLAGELIKKYSTAIIVPK